MGTYVHSYTFRNQAVVSWVQIGTWKNPVVKIDGAYRLVTGEEEARALLVMIDHAIQRSMLEEVPLEDQTRMEVAELPDLSDALLRRTEHFVPGIWDYFFFEPYVDRSQCMTRLQYWKEQRGLT